jgi:hypothetical protein
VIENFLLLAQLLLLSAVLLLMNRLKKHTVLNHFTVS